MSLSPDRFLEYKNTSSCMIVGDIILDKYVYGHVDRISPEAPIPVVATSDTRYVLGGAANVAGNISGFYVRAVLCGIIGCDSEGDMVIEKLKENGIKFSGYRSKDRCTTLKTRVVGMNQQLVRVDRELSGWLDESEENGLLSLIEAGLDKVEYVILSDYSKGVCSDSFCKKFFSLCSQKGKKIIVDPKSSNWTKYKGAYIITPNFKEFREAVGSAIENDETAISECASALMARYDIDKILVTRSQYGMTMNETGKVPITYKAKQQEVYDVSGAGDTVIAALTAALAVGYDVNAAVELSNDAAAVAVSRAGTYMVRLEDLIEYISGKGAWYEDKIVDGDSVDALVKGWKEAGEKIVFTNGCFDIMHIGHIDYLNRSRRLGTKLIVGLNSDASVKRLKGESRPVNGQKERALMLAALQCVDSVIIFDEDTPENLLGIIRPYYLVKGGDYTIDEIIGRQFAKEVITIPLTKGYSTTSIIEKIKRI